MVVPIGNPRLYRDMGTRKLSAESRHQWNVFRPECGRTRKRRHARKRTA